MRDSMFGALEIQILKRLTEERNFSTIAKYLGISKETVRRKVKALEYSLGRLRLQIDLYALGLSHVLLLSKNHIDIDKLSSSLYIRSIFHTYKVNSKYNAVIVTPPLKALDEYVTYLLRSLSDKKFDLYITYSPIYWTPDLTYIRNPRDPFLYNWSELCRDIEEAPNELKVSLKVQARKRKGVIDYIDLYILNQLEKDPLRSIRSIANSMKISQQLAHYHYKNHVMPVILSRNLRIFLKEEESIKGLLLLEFHSYDYLNKFLNVFISLPHCMTALLDIFKPNVIISYQVYSNQYTDFVEAMFELKRTGIVKEIKDYGLFTELIFFKRVLPWKYILTPNGWVVEDFVREVSMKEKLNYSLSKNVEVRLRYASEYRT